MPAPEEVVLALPASVLPVRHARSTVLLGSLATIRELGRFAEYETRLPRAHRDLLLGLVAGTWVPMDVAWSHYDTCEQLGFTQDQQVANGRSTFDKTSGTILGTMIRMAKEAGVTPWSVLPQTQRFWSRGYDGNGTGVTKLGPKEARMEVVHNRLCDSRYYRNALRGLVLGATELFCTKAYVTERANARAAGTMTMRIQWA